jgi:diacylglycerol kinase family enzyme
VRVALLYNVNAGEGVSEAGLRERLERGGHQVVQVLEKDDDIERALEESAELVVAAGGDGTVWRAARALAGRKIPLAILPLGTANNVARTLGIDGSISQLIGSWSNARLRPLDLGVACGGWGELRFLEGVGAGLISSGIAAMDDESPPDKGEDATSRLTRAMTAYRDLLSRLTPRRWAVSLDGARMEDEFLLLEVLNIRSLGPNLELAADADPSDGWFSVVTAREEHRDELDLYLRHRIERTGGRLSLPTRRARRVEILGWEEMHVDDEVLSGPSIGTVSIRIEAAALQFLVR